MPMAMAVTAISELPPPPDFAAFDALLVLALSRPSAGVARTVPLDTTLALLAGIAVVAALAALLLRRFSPPPSTPAP